MNKSLFAVSALVASLTMSGAAMAEGSIQHFGQSISHVGQSATHSAKATGDVLLGTTKLVSGVAAVPFKGIGAAADASNAVGDFLWDTATGGVEGDLKVSDEAVTAGPAPMFVINN